MGEARVSAVRFNFAISNAELGEVALIGGHPKGQVSIHGLRLV